MVDFIIKLLADWMMLPIILIGINNLSLMIPKGHRLDSYKRMLMAGLTAYLLASFVGYFYQPSAARPFEILGIAPGAAYLNNAGFPSDHILFAMVIFYAVWFEAKQKKIAYILLGLICLVSIGRVAAMVHSPIDIIGGIIFASIGCVWYIQPKKLKQ